tara:strand:- start:212 stop:436 length:225 start_codon:yes stop_codon:yes gene_type:complete
MELVKYEAAKKALAELTSIDEVQDYINKADKLAAYAKQAKDTELEFFAAENRLRAERKAGGMLKEMPKMVCLGE